MRDPVGVVVFAPLDIDESLVRALSRFLDDSELARARDFATSLLRRRFVAAHGIARLLLSVFCGERPERIVISSAQSGRPSVIRPVLIPSLDFSISRSDGWMVIGISQDVRIGVDLEMRRQGEPRPMALDTVLDSTELREVKRVLGERRVTKEEVFLRCWALKEAILKAHGSGLSIDPRDVVIDPSSLAAMLEAVAATPQLGATSPASSVIRTNDSKWSSRLIRFQGAGAAVSISVKEIDLSTVSIAQFTVEDVLVLVNDMLDIFSEAAFKSSDEIFINSIDSGVMSGNVEFERQRKNESRGCLAYLGRFNLPDPAAQN